LTCHYRFHNNILIFLYCWHIRFIRQELHTKKRPWPPEFLISRGKRRNVDWI
jgi:hypothetical protein